MRAGGTRLLAAMEVCKFVKRLGGGGKSSFMPAHFLGAIIAIAISHHAFRQLHRGNGSPALSVSAFDAAKSC